MQRIVLVENKDVGEKLSELVQIITHNFSVLMHWAVMFLLPFSVVYMVMFNAMHDTESALTDFVLLLVLMLSGVVSVTWLCVAFKHYFDNGKELSDLSVAELVSETLPMAGKALLTVLVYLVLVGVIGSGLLRIPYTSVFQGLGLFYLYFFIYCVIAALSVVAMIAICVVVYEGLVGVPAMLRAMRLVRENIFNLMAFIPLSMIITMFLTTLVSIPMDLGEGISILFLNPSEMNIPDWGYDVLEHLGKILVCFFAVTQVGVLGISMLLQYGDAVESLDNIWFNERMEKFEEL